MRPCLAVMAEAADGPAQAVALARRCGTRAGIELALDPDDLVTSMATARAILARKNAGTLGLSLDVRYQFPLGLHEIADADRTQGFRALEHVIAAISATAELGGSVLTVHAALPEEAHGTDQFWATAARLREAVRFGAERGVSVCLENLRWGATSNPLAFVELLNASGAGVTFDLGHANSSTAAQAGYPAERFARMLAGRIVGAHIYDRETDVHHAPATIDSIAPTLDVLLDWSCDWWTIELTRPGDVLHTAKLLNDYLDRALEQRHA